MSVNLALTIVHVVLAAVSAVHALLHKRRSHAALGWVVACLAIPFAGPLGYYLFGINRVRTRARRLQNRQHPAARHERLEPHVVPAPGLHVVSAMVTNRPLSHGNGVEILHNGDQVYPAMLGAIERAQRQILLATYILEMDETGLQFVDALGRAADRGVDVKVLVDGIGQFYSRRRVAPALRNRGIDVATFLPPKLLPPAFNINLRNHRKILAADDVAFAGGMNIRDRHIDRPSASRSVSDIHFRLQGPVVADLQQLFWRDWSFATGESPRDVTPCVQSTAKSAACRVIADGPDEDLDQLLRIFQGAVSAAAERVDIMTPYFLPPRELVGCLQAAALRGVEVNIVLPAENNLEFVHWATRNMLWELLQWRVNVFYQPPPFCHAKFMTIDNNYSLIGSPNIDSRSLRLNFELGIEVFDEMLAKQLREHCNQVLAMSNRITLADVDSRPFVQRIRDGLAWLFTPYL